MPRARRAVPPAEPLWIENTPHARVLHLEGIVGIAQATRLHQLALQLVEPSAPGARAEPASPVRIHSQDLRHLDGSATQVLLALEAELAKQGVAFSCHWPAGVDRVLRLAGITRLLTASSPPMPPAVTD